MSAKPFIFMFDIDGTLLASGGAGKAALEAAFLHEFELPTIRYQVSYAGRTDTSIIHELMERHELPVTTERVSRLQQGYLNRLPDALRQQRGRVLPGIVELLTELKKNVRNRIGLLTGNIRAGAERKLSHFELWHHFTFGGFGDQLHDRDDVARAAVRSFKSAHADEFAPDHIWVIGDTPLDIRCARAIGAKVLAVATGQHTTQELSVHAPDLVLANLQDVPTLLRQF